ncbi:hypothetical protein TWF481_010381 [Arthrobotrys musiformis]|uniref:BZIP domain-containing protein n=1 Tax=Arthrobotrys musiformis TaxID=47236 RepID=A0AAV9W6K8_9PEZI
MAETVTTHEELTTHLLFLSPATPNHTEHIPIQYSSDSGSISDDSDSSIPNSPAITAPSVLEGSDQEKFVSFPASPRVVQDKSVSPSKERLPVPSFSNRGKNGLFEKAHKIKLREMAMRCKSAECQLGMLQTSLATERERREALENLRNASDKLRQSQHNFIRLLTGLGLVYLLTEATEAQLNVIYFLLLLLIRFV